MTLRLIAIVALIWSAVTIGVEGSRSRVHQQTEQGATADVADVLARTRSATGVAERTIASLQIRGDWKRVVGEAVDSTVELSWKAPDQFVVEDIRTMDVGQRGLARMATRSGFSGSTRIFESFPVDLPPSTFVPAPPKVVTDEGPIVESRKLESERRKFGRYFLALLAASPEVFPLTFSLPANVDGPADATTVLKATAVDGYAYTLEFDRATHLLTQLSWIDAPVHVVGTQEDASTAPVDYRMTLSNYATDRGITWPRRMTTMVGGELYEDLKVTRYLVNPKLDPRIFRIPKS